MLIANAVDVIDPTDAAATESVLDATATAAESVFKNTTGDIFQLIFLLIIFFVVVFLAYYTTKVIGGAKFNKKGGNIDIIESRSIGVSSAIQLVKVGRKYFLIGVTKEHINFLTEIDVTSDEDFIKTDVSGTPNPVIPFEKILSKYIKKTEK